jgi:hypothetical protein
MFAGACGYDDPLDMPPPPADPPRGETVPFRRVSSRALWIEPPGVLVIRDDSAWAALWRRYLRHPVDSIPRVDFGREMVAAISRGFMTGCGNSAAYVWKVERARDTLFVVTAYDGYPGSMVGVTCMMENAPVDLVVIPRGPAVAFVGFTASWPVPPPARWLGPITVAEADTMPPARRDRAYMAVARDTASPRGELGALVERLEHRPDPALLDALARNPRVRQDLSLLARLARMRPGDPGEVGDLLLDRFGPLLARDPATDPVLLAALVARLDREQGVDADLARILLHHPAVLADSGLLWNAATALVRAGHASCAEARALWRRQFPDDPSAPCDE